MKNKLVYIIGGTLVAGSLIFGGTAISQETAARPAMFGSVVAIEGSRVTVSGKSGKDGATTIYTVDTSDAKITEGLGQGATALSTQNVAVGDQVAVLATAID